jgi:hypothetical protein
VILFSGIGAYFFGTAVWEPSIYGFGQPGIVTALLAVGTAGLWRLLGLVTAQLREPQQPEVMAVLALHLEQPRRLALWAAGLALLLVPVGALYGPLLARYVSRLPVAS